MTQRANILFPKSDLNFIPGTNMGEGENRLLQVH